MNTAIHRLLSRGLPGVLLCIAAASAQARPHDYRIDPVHTRVWFEVRHLEFSSAMGAFSAPNGWLRFDPDDVASAQVEAELDLRTLDLGDPDWNRRLARGDAFDSAAHPLARFVSTGVDAIDGHRFRVRGTLSLRGASHPLELDVVFNRAGRHPLTLRRTVGFSAEARLSRAALGFGAWKSMVGDEVLLRIEVEAQRKTRREGATP